MQEQAILLLKIIVAMVLGGLIGYNRERANKAAGLRTHMCVAGSSAFFVGIALPLLEYFSLHTYGDLVRSDPIRIIEATITGVAFLGAGTIIKGRQENVYGLTTAASLLLTAAVGVSVAMNFYLLAVGLTCVTCIVLSVLSRFIHT